MDKRFKFRAWVKGNNIMWPYADLRIGGYVNELLLREGEAVIMQCTGLTDKDGCYVYEGDIVYIHGELFEIEFADACFWIHKTDYSMELHTIVGKIDRVIGNIYENPELLEGDND